MSELSLKDFEIVVEKSNQDIDIKNWDIRSHLELLAN